MNSTSPDCEPFRHAGGSSSVGSPEAGPAESAEPILQLDSADPTEPRWVNFFEPEQFSGRHFRWSRPVAMVRLDIPPGVYRVAIETGGLRGADCSFSFRLLWNGVPIERRRLRIDEGRIEFCPDPASCAVGLEQRLTVTSRPLRAENGRRQLGMPICSVSVWDARAASASGASSEPARGVSPRRRLRLSPKKPPRPVVPIWQIQLPEVPAPSHRDGAAAVPCEQAVVSSVEINSRHGTGLLIQYLLPDLSRCATVNSVRCYHGERVPSAVHHYLPSPKPSRAGVYRIVHDWFAEAPPAHAYVVPFFESDLHVAMALKDLFGTRIALHVMDDNCLHAAEIACATMQEAIAKSDLRLAISPELRRAYEQRFGARFWMLPPIVPGELIGEPAPPAAPPAASWTCRAPSPARRVSEGSSAAPPAGSWTRRVWQRLNAWLGRARRPGSTEPRGILIGNVWNRNWLDLLRSTVRESGMQLDWYSNNPEAVWLKDSLSNLAADGIHLQPPLWGRALVDELRRRRFAVMPSGRLDPGEERESIARLSLPSRMPFVAATAQLPVIVLGSRETAAARFVERFGLGLVTDYDGAQLRRAAEQVGRPAAQAEIRTRARELSATFSADGLDQWLWRSLAAREPVDDRFERLFRPQAGELTWYFDASPPPEVAWSFRETWQMLRRLRRGGCAPRLVIDVGASNGIWSATAASVFPEAHFVLIDPLTSRYDAAARQHYLASIARHDVLEVALSDHSGRIELIVSNDLFGSSLLKVQGDLRSSRNTTVDVWTLDELARRKTLTGPALLKIDVQFAEHLVLAGGADFIREHVEMMILELSLQREHPEAKTYSEMLALMERLGFELFDEMDGWRNPQTGRLEQKDAAFRRIDRAAGRRAA